MNYTYNYIPHDIYLYKGINMRNCSYCGTSFKLTGPEKCCSVKCKILYGIKKDENECWIWQGNSNNGNYGKLRWKCKWISCHRASYQEFVGDIEQNKMVCHKCDVKLCINPNHLFIGTQKDNIKDASNKRRRPLGEKNHFSIFTNKQIEEMRNLKDEGFTYNRLKDIFNCSIAHLYNVFKNKYRKE